MEINEKVTFFLIYYNWFILSYLLSLLKKYNMLILENSSSSFFLSKSILFDNLFFLRFSLSLFNQNKGCWQILSIHLHIYISFNPFCTCSPHKSLMYVFCIYFETIQYFYMVYKKTYPFLAHIWTHLHIIFCSMSEKIFGWE